MCLLPAPCRITNGVGGLIPLFFLQPRRFCGSNEWSSHVFMFDFGQENGVSAFFVFGFASHSDRWSPLFGFGPMYDIIQYC